MKTEIAIFHDNDTDKLEEGINDFLDHEGVEYVDSHFTAPKTSFNNFEDAYFVLIYKTK